MNKISIFVREKMIVCKHASLQKYKLIWKISKQQNVQVCKMKIANGPSKCSACMSIYIIIMYI